MSTPRSLEDFVEFLAALDHEGFSFAVIGGCAVGAYARMRGEAVFSADLDVYVTASILPELLAWAERQGIKVVKRPQARTIPVAVLDWRGQEVNVLAGSEGGLPPPDVVLRTARELELAEHNLRVALADPFDILASKLALRRPQDLPHIEILRQFVEAEVTEVFNASSLSPRERLVPIRRLLDVLSADRIPFDLGERLLAGADDPTLRRFLVARLQSEQQVARVIDRAADPTERALLDRIAAAR